MSAEGTIASTSTGVEALTVKGLSVSLRRRQGDLPILREVSLDVGAGEVVGLVGESGCGKSLTALTVLGLSPPVMKVTAGKVLIRGQDVLRARRRQLQTIRGLQVGMIFPDPSAALDPLMRVGTQVEECLTIHRVGSRTERRERVGALLTHMGLPHHLNVSRRYPHELSGGMQQRVVIAGALAASPGLIIADEPTTALDAAVRSQILRRLADERRNGITGVLVISHDLGAVARVADRLIVMYGGRVVESAPTAQLLSHPRHRYTRALMDIFAGRQMRLPRDADLPTIPGHVPSPGEVGAGCPFVARCAAATPVCELMPPLEATDPAHTVACWHPVAAENDEARVALGSQAPGAAIPSVTVTVDVAAASDEADAPVSERKPILTVDRVSKKYGDQGLGSRRAPIWALNQISLSVAEGEVLGVVGETGSGKSTLGRLALGLERPTEGTVSFRGLGLASLPSARLRALRREMQPVWQDPYAAMNPRMRVDDIVSEPFIVHEHMSGPQARARVESLLHMVGLDAAMGRRYPHELSSGQRQRVVIARAVALQPRFVVCDEPLAALDVSVQAKIINLLRRLQIDLGLTYLFISHDLWATRLIASWIAVLYRGRMVELGPSEAIMEHPVHPYTRMLITAEVDDRALTEDADWESSGSTEASEWRVVGPDHWAALGDGAAEAVPKGRGVKAGAKGARSD